MKAYLVLDFSVTDVARFMPYVKPASISSCASVQPASIRSSTRRSISARGYEGCTYLPREAAGGRRSLRRRLPSH